MKHLAIPSEQLQEGWKIDLPVEAIAIEIFRSTVGGGDDRHTRPGWRSSTGRRLEPPRTPWDPAPKKGIEQGQQNAAVLWQQTLAAISSKTKFHGVKLH